MLPDDKKPFYKQIAEEIITFVKRGMIGTDGAFYSAIDADSEGVEGKYYVWDKKEILQILGTSLGQLYCDVYNITADGNFEGMNIPIQIEMDLAAIEIDYDLDHNALKEKLKMAREKMLEVRAERVYPHVDDKILTSWNALMIAALAKAGKAFDSQEDVDVAEKALTFLETHLIEQNRVMARYRDGK